MSEVSASLVKQLREDTSVGMMDCKKALQESAGDIVKAKAWLRKKGLAGAQAKSSRTTEQGLVALAIIQEQNKDSSQKGSQGVAQGGAQGGAQGVLVELNAETDFVARNESFQKFLSQVTQTALSGSATSAEKLLALAINTQSNKQDNEQDNKQDNKQGDTVEQALQALISTIGENMRLRRCAYLAVENGLVASYMHSRIEGEYIQDSSQDSSQESSQILSMGKIGVLLALESNASKNILGELGKSIAMHIAAANPSVIVRQDLAPQKIAEEEDILKEQAARNSKENAPIDKIVAGRMEKFFRATILQEQKYALDETKSIASMLEEASKKAGDTIRIKGFHRFELGEKINSG